MCAALLKFVLARSRLQPVVHVSLGEVGGRNALGIRLFVLFFGDCFLRSLPSASQITSHCRFVSPRFTLKASSGLLPQGSDAACVSAASWLSGSAGQESASKPHDQRESLICGLAGPLKDTLTVGDASMMHPGVGLQGLKG